jgi:hypothetical protein
MRGHGIVARNGWTLSYGSGASAILLVSTGVGGEDVQEEEDGVQSGLHDACCASAVHIHI